MLIMDELGGGFAVVDLQVLCLQLIPAETGLGPLSEKEYRFLEVKIFRAASPPRALGKAHAGGSALSLNLLREPPHGSVTMSFLITADNMLDKSHLRKEDFSPELRRKPEGGGGGE